MFHWYGFFIGLAIVAGYSVAEKIEPKVSKVVPWVIGLGLLGARVWHVVDTWSYYSQNLSYVVAVWNGGLSIWGGLLGGGIAVLIYQRINIPMNQRKEEVGKILGAIATALPLAQAIGRLGNAVNGEFTQRVGILPWWGAEALLDLMLFALLRGLSSKYRVGIYLAGYGLIRLVLQPYRL